MILVVMKIMELSTVLSGVRASQIQKFKQSISSTSFVPIDELQDNSLYHWQVKATDQLGLSYTTPIQTFVVNQENDNPEPFALIAPENESMLTELTTSFHWDVPEDVDYGSSISYYEFLINTENNFDEIDPIIVNTNSYTRRTSN